MRSRIIAAAGAGIVLASSLSMAPVVLADTEHSQNTQVPVIICEPTSNSYSVSLANTNIPAPLQTITETIAGALGLRLVSQQDTTSNVGSSSAISTCEQLAQAQQRQ
ncbi:MAG TPA: hypothetical protein VKY90_02340 [Candidatus Dormibacteraeota bacterium]|nr:hypothetical protein [Candidatus Dormibacteraeota bacterium]